MSSICLSQNRPDFQNVVSIAHNVNDRQRLVNENRLLKNNFLRMSRIIQKHSRLLAKKDEMIARLQEKNANQSVPRFPNASQTCLRVNDSDNCRQEVIKSEELRTKSEEFSAKFKLIYESMIGDFGQHLTQFISIIEEMQRFFENNLRAIERRNSLDAKNDEEFKAKILALNAEYSSLKSSYDAMTKQNEDMKTIVSSNR